MDPRHSLKPNQWAGKGQIVVEYILLLVIGVGLATLLIALLVNRNPESPGVVIQKWNSIIRMIGVDYADDLQDNSEEDGGS